MPKAVACLNCGVPRGYGNRFCPHCNAQSHEAAVICVACGAALAKSTVIGQGASRTQSLPIAPKSIDEAVLGISGQNQDYYRDEFQAIQNAGGGFKVSFNWVAFLLGPIWYFYHGMWKKALIQMGASFVTLGFIAPLIWIYNGMAANYDLYLLKVEGKELW